MSLGEINSAALFNYNVVPQDITDLQGFGFEQLRTYLRERRSRGVLSGLTIIPGTGLDVKVQPGLVMLPDGKIAYLAAEVVVSLAAAHASLSRIDRIEAAFSLVNDRAGTLEDGTAVTVVKLHALSASSSVGTPGATPVAPALTSGSVSLGLVTVAPLATIVASTAIDMSLRSRDYSQERNDSVVHSILNAQAAAISVAGLAVDKAKYKQVIFEGDLYRKSAASSKTSWVRLVLSYNVGNDTWLFLPTIEGEDPGVTFTFDQSKQEVQYVSTDFTGGSYVGELRLRKQILER